MMTKGKRGEKREDQDPVVETGEGGNEKERSVYFWKL
jgi:hypothetical protein